MKDIYHSAIIVSWFIPVFSDVCYYDDGTRFGETTLCAGTCCGTGKDPCCVDGGSIIAIVVGVVVSMALLIVCIVICCAHRAHSKRYTLPRQQRLQQRLSELHTVSNQYQVFGANNNRSNEQVELPQYQVFGANNNRSNEQVELPPRYSDIFPRPCASNQSSLETIRTSLGSRSSFSSFRRNSDSRRSIRRGRNSGSLSRQHNNLSVVNQNSGAMTVKEDNEIRINDRADNSSFGQNVLPSIHSPDVSNHEHSSSMLSTV